MAKLKLEGNKMNIDKHANDPERNPKKSVYVVYVHKNAGNIFYVGSGKAGREHDFQNGRSSNWHEAFTAAKSKGTFEIENVAYFENKKQASNFESKLIKKYGRHVDGGTLINHITGREDPINWSKQLFIFHRYDVNGKIINQQEPMTIYTMAKRHNLLLSSLKNVVCPNTSKTYSIKGWCLIGTPSEKVGRGRQGVANPNYDSKRYHFIHLKSGEEFNGTQDDFFNRFKNSNKINKPGICNLIKGKQKSHMGWILFQNLSQLLDEGKIYKIINSKDGSVLTETKKSLLRMGFKPHTLNRLFSGKIQQTHDGWYLSKPSNRTASTHRYVVETACGKEFTGTQSEIHQTLKVLGIGVSRQKVSKVCRGESISEIFSIKNPYKASW